MPMNWLAGWLAHGHTHSAQERPAMRRKVEAEWWRAESGDSTTLYLSLSLSTSKRAYLGAYPRERSTIASLIDLDFVAIDKWETGIKAQPYNFSSGFVYYSELVRSICALVW